MELIQTCYCFVLYLILKKKTTSLELDIVQMSNRAISQLVWRVYTSSVSFVIKHIKYIWYVYHLFQLYRFVYSNYVFSSTFPLVWPCVWFCRTARPLEDHLSCRIPGSIYYFSNWWRVCILNFNKNKQTKQTKKLKCCMTYSYCTIMSFIIKKKWFLSYLLLQSGFKRSHFFSFIPSLSYISKI